LESRGAAMVGRASSDRRKHAEKRVALIVGNAAYKNAATLRNPRNDVQDVAAALQRLGFETIVHAAPGFRWSLVDSHGNCISRVLSFLGEYQSARKYRHCKFGRDFRCFGALGDERRLQRFEAFSVFQTGFFLNPGRRPGASAGRVAFLT
jgi:hypothetical protein